MFWSGVPDNKLLLLKPTFGMHRGDKEIMILTIPLSSTDFLNDPKSNERILTFLATMSITPLDKNNSTEFDPGEFLHLISE